MQCFIHHTVPIMWCFFKDLTVTHMLLRNVSTHSTLPSKGEVNKQHFCGEL